MKASGIISISFKQENLSGRSSCCKVANWQSPIGPISIATVEVHIIEGPSAYLVEELHIYLPKWYDLCNNDLASDQDGYAEECQLAS